MNVVLTSLLTSQPDPQRGEKWPADLSLFDGLLGSLTGCDFVVFADECDDPRVTRVDPGGNPYTYRWRLVRDWLTEHDDAGYVWAVDGSDVEMLHEPWADMFPGVLYVGAELNPIRNEWMTRHHPGSRRFIEAFAGNQLLNAGIVGGDRATLLAFTTRLCERLEQVAAIDSYDMGAFNEIAWTEFAARFVCGQRVHTVFRAEDRTNPFAWWRHK